MEVRIRDQCGYLDQLVVDPGVVGAGGRMRQLLNSAENSGVPFEIVSVCDVYTPRRDEVKSRASASNAATYGDYKQVLDDKSVDAVLIATPDHWHVRIAAASLAATTTWPGEPMRKGNPFQSLILPPAPSITGTIAR